MLSRRVQVRSHQLIEQLVNVYANCNANRAAEKIHVLGYIMYSLLVIVPPGERVPYEINA